MSQLVTAGDQLDPAETESHWSRPLRTLHRSTSAVDRDLKSSADFVHAPVGQAAESRDEQGDRDALDGVQIDG